MADLAAIRHVARVLRADKALYAAKRAGRNCCVVAEPTAESASQNPPTTA